MSEKTPDAPYSGGDWVDPDPGRLAAARAHGHDLPAAVKRVTRELFDHSARDRAAADLAAAARAGDDTTACWDTHDGEVHGPHTHPAPVPSSAGHPRAEVERWVEAAAVADVRAEAAERKVADLRAGIEAKIDAAHDDLVVADGEPHAACWNEALFAMTQRLRAPAGSGEQPGPLKSGVMALTSMSSDEIDVLGGVREDAPVVPDSPGVQITTTAELDALPVGSVIRCCHDEDGGAGNVAHKEAGCWFLAGCVDAFGSEQLAAGTPDHFTVLFRPDAPLHACDGLPNRPAPVVPDSPDLRERAVQAAAEAIDDATLSHETPAANLERQAQAAADAVLAVVGQGVSAEHPLRVLAESLATLDDPAHIHARSQTTLTSIIAHAQFALREADRPVVRPTVTAEQAWDEGHRIGWEHHQDGNYGTDYWDDDAPNPYRAVVRPDEREEGL